MKHQMNASWNGRMGFETELNGHKLMMDAPKEVGGDDLGPRPKVLMLAALAGCTGMDVVSILRKMRVNVEDCNVGIEADMSEEHPKSYTKMHVTYTFKGKDLPMDKLQKAVNLSEERYCGVGTFYRKVIEVTSEIVVLES